MFPLKADDPYITTAGERSTLGDAIGGGGGGQSGGTNILKGTTIPDDSLGNEGDIYLLIPDKSYQSFDITINKALRGESEENYFGAQEIQLMLTNGNETKNITEFSNFAYSGPGSVQYLFDGETTTGTYWEVSSPPKTVQFGADIPPGWTLDRLIIWQRNSAQYLDVWKDFEFSVNGTPILHEKNLTYDDWAGPGLGTAFDIPPVGLKNIPSVYYKINYGGSVKWIS